MKKKRNPAGKVRGNRKPYRTPALVVHGDIKAITNAKGGGSNDGTGKPKTKSPTGSGT